MKAQQLHIGNLVRIENDLLAETKKMILSVTGISERHEKDFPESENVISLKDTRSIRMYNQFEEFIQPIPLTEDWLKRAGFDKWDFDEPYDRYVLHNVIDGSSNFEVHRTILYDENLIPTSSLWFPCLDDSACCWADFKYVHQLQNLFHALTGTELQFTER